MSQKQLHIYLQNNNIERLTTALPLCIALSETKLKPWFYQNYLEIYSLTTNFIDIIYNDSLSYTNNELFPLEIKTVSYSFISQDIINLIKQYIEKNYYIIIFVDEFYMRNSSSYLKHHFNHEYLIYGYNEQDKVLSGIGFLNTKFTTLDLMFDDLSKAFHSAKMLQQREDFAGDHELYLLRKKDYKNSFPFQIQTFKTKIANYLLSTLDLTSIYIKNIDDYKYNLGISVYNSIIEHLDLYCMEKHNYYYNSIHAFYEHKKGILTRLNYIYQTYHYELENIIKEYQEVVNGINNIRLLYIKLGQTLQNKNKICERIKINLCICKDKEYNILSKLLFLI